MLSFAYTLLAHDVAAALETVGLDPYVGFLHRDRPGRISLALDMMEELRTVFADRFVISLINKREVSSSGFTQKENGAVIMEDDTRKTILKAWQSRKQEVITHPFLGEKLEWGLVPYAQAMLLARLIRGDLDGYPPFMWK
jgi:CRISPR-associated protein Cas1